MHRDRLLSRPLACPPPRCRHPPTGVSTHLEYRGVSLALSKEASSTRIRMLPCGYGGSAAASDAHSRLSCLPRSSSRAFGSRGILTAVPLRTKGTEAGSSTNRTEACRGSYVATRTAKLSAPAWILDAHHASHDLPAPYVPPIFSLEEKLPRAIHSIND